MNNDNEYDPVEDKKLQSGIFKSKQDFQTAQPEKTKGEDHGHPLGEPLGDAGPHGVSEPSRDNVIRIDMLQITKHPNYWGPILQAADLATGKILFPEWRAYDRNKRLPEESFIPISPDAMQKLFDSMWLAGHRPTGFQIVMESSPVEFPVSLRDEMDDICKELSKNSNSKYYFEDYFSEFDGERIQYGSESVIWEKVASEETSIILTEFHSLDEVIAFAVDYRLTQRKVDSELEGDL